MSISEAIRDQIQSGMLRPLRPRSPLARLQRILLMTERFSDEISNGQDDYLSKERKGILRADLETFVSEESLDHKYLYWLEPKSDCVWEIRSIRDAPSIRVLGLFPEKDVFVATNVYLREDLGSWDSENWKQAKRNAMAQWRSIFHTYQPIGLQGEEINDFFSGALSGEYFKDRRHN